MLSEYEKDRLMERMKAEMGATLRVVLKCGVCLLLVVGLAVIGATTAVDIDDEVLAVRYGEGEALQQSRALYRERQAQFGRHLPGRGATPGVMAEAAAAESGALRD